MPECCIDDAFLSAMRGLDCTPVPAANHYSFIRIGEECLPYVVVTTSIVAGLRTTDGVEKVDQVRISAYFSVDKLAECNKFKALVENWVFGKNCIDLAGCGCFCVRSVVPSQLTIKGGTLLFSVTLTGKYSAAVAV